MFDVRTEQQQQQQQQQPPSTNANVAAQSVQTKSPRSLADYFAPPDTVPNDMAPTIPSLSNNDTREWQFFTPSSTNAVLSDHSDVPTAISNSQMPPGKEDLQSNGPSLYEPVTLTAQSTSQSCPANTSQIDLIIEQNPIATVTVDDGLDRFTPGLSEDEKFDNV
ncbi:unnamed protein product [Echinostoma caproni]|uniref:Uncharacterized protein n=1 Tax=Echinostoma caproni TaxID=27848 RepID=A0A3P8L980_9TREM|nr:unnamed protein product [Echinostoma caproni]